MIKLIPLLFLITLSGCTTIHDGTNTNSGNVDIVIWGGCDKLEKEKVE